MDFTDKKKTYFSHHSRIFKSISLSLTKKTNQTTLMFYIAHKNPVIFLQAENAFHRMSFNTSSWVSFMRPSMLIQSTFVPKFFVTFRTCVWQLPSVCPDMLQTKIQTNYVNFSPRTDFSENFHPAIP